MHHTRQTTLMPACGRRCTREYLLELCLKGAGKHVRKEAESDGQKNFCERYDDEKGEWNHAEDVGCGACQLSPLTPSQRLPLQLFPDQPSSDTQLQPKELEAYLNEAT
jgi:hypothetical protein